MLKLNHHYVLEDKSYCYFSQKANNDYFSNSIDSYFLTAMHVEHQKKHLKKDKYGRYYFASADVGFLRLLLLFTKAYFKFKRG